MNATITRHLSSDIPSLTENGRSEWYLVRVKTPSVEYWDLARYDSSYSKSRPWRNHTNHGVEIVHYYDLPPAE